MEWTASAPAIRRAVHREDDYRRSGTQAVGCGLEVWKSSLVTCFFADSAMKAGAVADGRPQALWAIEPVGERGSSSAVPSNPNSRLDNDHAGVEDLVRQLAALSPAVVGLESTGRQAAGGRRFGRCRRLSWSVIFVE